MDHKATRRHWEATSPFKADDHEGRERWSHTVAFFSFQRTLHEETRYCVYSTLGLSASDVMIQEPSYPTDMQLSVCLTARMSLSSFPNLLFLVFCFVLVTIRSPNNSYLSSACDSR